MDEKRNIIDIKIEKGTNCSRKRNIKENKDKLNKNKKLWIKRKKKLKKWKIMKI